MNGGYTESSRTLIYFGICIPLRSFLTYIAVKSKINKNNRIFNIMRLLFFGMGLAFLKDFLIKDKPTHGFFGGKIWWRNLTPIHSLLYLIFAISKNTNLLMFDLIVSLLGFFFLKP
jgi:hypothetical protein